ncbi:MAG TPA: nucleotidyl transferase AbiEii/AbiGii toxin family protein [Burkholderiales bacterium]|nr:nucleotidyl transferase AbiEii/AbiGii toxin family protein [Burkholderiales bacterium]
MIANLAASIHARLLARAKERGEDFNLVLTRYGIERILYRLSVSPARDHYLLKGALLFDLWFDVPHRPTRDADFLGFGAADRDVLGRHVRDVCVVAVEDGMVFDPESVSIEEIRDDTRYGGLRVKLFGLLAGVPSSSTWAMATRLLLGQRRSSIRHCWRTCRRRS